MSYQGIGLSRALRRARVMAIAAIAVPAFTGVLPAALAAEPPADSSVTDSTGSDPDQPTDPADDYPGIESVRAVTQSVAEAINASVGDMQGAATTDDPASGRWWTEAQRYLLLPGFDDVSIRTKLVHRPTQEVGTGTRVTGKMGHDVVTLIVTHDSGDTIKVKIFSNQPSNPSLADLPIPISVLTV